MDSSRRDSALIFTGSERSITHSGQKHCRQDRPILHWRRAEWGISSAGDDSDKAQCAQQENLDNWLENLSWRNVKVKQVKHKCAIIYKSLLINSKAKSRVRLFRSDFLELRVCFKMAVPTEQGKNSRMCQNIIKPSQKSWIRVKAKAILIRQSLHIKSWITQNSWS